MAASAEAMADVSISKSRLLQESLSNAVPMPRYHQNYGLDHDNINVLSVGTIRERMESPLEKKDPLERARLFILNKDSSRYKEALEILSDREQVNTPVAQYFLGMIYYHGLGVAKDYEKAFKHMSASYEGGDLNALYYLGVMYLDGHGVKHTPN